MLRPIRLRADNFTPATRTPWGGEKILRRYKPHLVRRSDAAGSASPIVGESWEISVEPSFPSQVDGSDQTLAQRIAADPLGWLGNDVAAASGGQLSLLVKLLDAADNLSVQVHPAADDPTLAAHESGKPESWVILEREPGGCLYLGFRDGVSRADVLDCLQRGGDLSTLMNVVPVEPWDVFVIEAGTPHAIGAGVTLFEPQYITPGRVGLTYRFWDWNRRYDAEGRPDPDGRPRALHVEDSLRVTSWAAPRGAAFVESCRPQRAIAGAGEGLPPLDWRWPLGEWFQASSTSSSVRGGMRIKPSGGRFVGEDLWKALPSVRGTRGVEVQPLVDWRYFRVARLSGAGRVRLEAPPTLTALTCLGGTLRVESAAGELTLRKGESGVAPHAAGALELRLGVGSRSDAVSGDESATVIASWPGVGDQTR